MDFFKIAEKIVAGGPVGDEELNAFNLWLRSEQGRQRFTAKMEEELNKYMDERVLDMESTLNEIHRRSIKRRVSKRPFVRAGIWAAASVAVIGIVGVLLLTADREDFVYPVYEGEFGSQNKAVLTLSDGTKVVMEDLDSSHVVEIGAVVTLGKGELEYAETADVRPDAFHEIYIPVGGELRLKLHDGTVVWLNSDTRLRYPMRFSGDERRMILDGEAYFDVAHDPDKPFRVETAGMSVTALGTEFNIYAYSNEKSIAATLTSGSVLVTTADGETTITPGQQALLDGESGRLAVKDVNVTNIIAWKNGFIGVEDLTLEQIMNKLARWYGAGYEIEEGISRDRKYRGIITKHDIEDTLDKLEMISNLKLRLDGNVIKVKK